MAAAAPLSDDAVHSVLIQLDGLLNKRRTQRALEATLATGDRAAAADLSMQVGMAATMCEWDRTPGAWGWLTPGHCDTSPGGSYGTPGAGAAAKGARMQAACPQGVRLAGARRLERQRVRVVTVPG
jgi:hypothetical protein